MSLGVNLRKALFGLVALAAAVIVAVPFLDGVIEAPLIIKISRIATAIGILVASLLHVPFQPQLPPSPGSGTNTGGVN